MKSTAEPGTAGTHGGQPTEEYLTVPEWARMVRLTPKHAYRLAKEGGIRGAEQIGKTWRISRAAWPAPHHHNSAAPAVSPAEAAEGTSQ